MKKLTVVAGRLSEKKGQLTQYGDDYAAAPSRVLASMIEATETEIARLEADNHSLQATLSTERSVSMGYDEYMRRVDLISPEGRHKANTLVKRLGATVYIGPLGYAVIQKGRVSFGMAYRDGQAGYLGTVGPFPPKNRELHELAEWALKGMRLTGVFTPATDAGVQAESDQVDAEETAAERLPD